MFGIVEKGSTNVTRYIMLIDSTAFTPETAYTITDLDLQYTRNRSTAAAKVDATALSAVDDAHDDNKAIEIDSTSSPGLYRVDWPDAAFATGVDKVTLVVSGAGLAPVVEHIKLVNDDFDSIGSDTAAILLDTGTDGVVIGSAADVYWSKTSYARDTGSGNDEYRTIWFKNGEPLTSGVTLPKIWVEDDASTDKIGTIGVPGTMTESATHVFKYDASAAGEKVAAGVGLSVMTWATIDAVERKWREVFERDT